MKKVCIMLDALTDKILIFTSLQMSVKHLIHLHSTAILVFAWKIHIANTPPLALEDFKR